MVCLVTFFVHAGISAGEIRHGKNIGLLVVLGKSVLWKERPTVQLKEPTEVNTKPCESAWPLTGLTPRPLIMFTGGQWTTTPQNANTSSFVGVQLEQLVTGTKQVRGSLLRMTSLRYVSEHCSVISQNRRCDKSKSASTHTQPAFKLPGPPTLGATVNKGHQVVSYLCCTDGALSC